MVMRKLLYRLGLAPLSELHELRGLNAVLFGRARALEAENETLAGWVAWHQNEADSLRAENINLKRAASERLRDETPFEQSMLMLGFNIEPPFGRVWSRPDPTGSRPPADNSDRETV